MQLTKVVSAPPASRINSTIINRSIVGISASDRIVLDYLPNSAVNCSVSPNDIFMVSQIISLALEFADGIREIIVSCWR